MNNYYKLLNLNHLVKNCYHFLFKAIIEIYQFEFSLYYYSCYTGMSIEGQNAVVLGRSKIVVSLFKIKATLRYLQY